MLRVECWMLRGECWMLKDGGWEMKVESWKTAPAFTWVTPSSHSGEDAEGRRGLLWILQSTKENHKEAKRCNRIFVPPFHETPWESKICDRLASYSRLHDSKYIITRWKSAVILFFLVIAEYYQPFFAFLLSCITLQKRKHHSKNARLLQDEVSEIGKYTPKYHGLILQIPLFYLIFQNSWCISYKTLNSKLISL